MPERTGKMKKGASVLLLAALVMVAGVSADTLRLRSGQTVEFACGQGRTVPVAVDALLP